MADTEIIVEECRFAFIFKSVEPVPENELLSWLLADGFEKIEDLPKRIGNTTFGMERLNIARKKSSEVLYDDKQGTLIVVGKHPKDNFEVFKLVEKILKKNDLDLSDNVKSYEFGLSGRVFIKGKHKPLEKISSFIGYEKLSKFEKIIGEEVAAFDVRVCPKRLINNSESLRTINDWFDIHIFPNVANPNYYSVRAVFRDISIAKISKFSEEINAKITSILSIINGS